jgi:hypothetical protein
VAGDAAGAAGAVTGGTSAAGVGATLIQSGACMASGVVADAGKMPSGQCVSSAATADLSASDGAAA